jgi:hypothetical protein
MGEKKNAYRILVGKPEGQSPLGRPRRRWVDDISVGTIQRRESALKYRRTFLNTHYFLEKFVETIRDCIRAGSFV